eukprot:CAMPEP_0196821568 /NCGR_PEP_ID=MMETSP1362-20130617/79873_1 /TAXON_ID=163516 /ORGANISM="Leptocylindrus danicus, Strain CCMP1856" /LENGTH=461 /DNA_ID=CAMNT_0042200803 /DNA_START=23 /DNA_END=1408 /DNA_ORIENTATION=-
MAQHDEDITNGSPRKTKRSADRQITKDDDENEDNEESGLEAGAFKRASAEKMASRKIVRASKKFSAATTKVSEPAVTVQQPSSNGAHAEDGKDGMSEAAVTTKDAPASLSSSATSNPFANFQFGTKDASTGTTVGVNKPTGISFSSSANTNPFASIATSTDEKGVNVDNSDKNGAKAEAPTLSFASAGSSNPFAAAAASFGSGSSSGGFGTLASNGKSTFAAFGSKAPAPAPTATFPPAGSDSNGTIIQGDIANGEEEEECVLQCRAKLFRLCKKAAAAAVPQEAAEGTGLAASHVGPPTLPSAAKKESVDDSKDEHENDKDEEKTGAKTAKDGKDIRSDDSSSSGTEWREVGIGPLRVLRTESKSKQITTRCVMRREMHPGGPGTKVILNMKLIKLANIKQSGEKFVRLTTVAEEGEPVNYLFKLKTVDEVERLIKHIESGIADASEAGEAEKGDASKSD